MTKLKIKVPQTMEEAAKLRNGLERVMHQTPRPALNFLSNAVYALKATIDLADLLRPAKQAALAYQLERYAEASVGAGPQ
ncbi:hypothetical protein [Bradyrhizobium elkanii]|uniref:hypothetical protein n=1 Tax=Bradyrhizobium elkanii TaxID=29448 RepID=UPI001449627C|nr:hypothetical protein [Bradyrhizobium elkanii]MCP1932490.1 hypothetical protein [Bradyrhizobium elkanii]MCS3479583.1 hypothetical protein [Bradyrhizobium elkanii]MCS3576971.1 hypothetical protein [Bradyrhizobium elkanii]MCS3719848.1 hypothetical protein [Bradyrhizobium elkanii]MCS4004265.1 hypothetical protein [Bradyrhizobium elkanii USDA 61]